MKQPVHLSPFAGDPEIGDTLVWDGEGWVPMRQPTKWGLLQEWRSRMMSAVMEGPDVDVMRVAIGVRIGRGGDTVLLFDNGGDPVAEYNANGAGLAAALAAASSGEVVQIPAALTLDRAITVPAGVTLRGPGKITATGAYSNLITVNGRLESVEIDYSTSDSSGYVAAVYSDDGPELIRDVIASTTASGNCQPCGLYLKGIVDKSLIEGCLFYGKHTVINSNCYGVYIDTPAGDDEHVCLISSVFAYGWVFKSGATATGMYVGATLRTVLTGCYADGRSKWGGGSANGILAYNCALTGCYGKAHAEGTAGDTVGLRVDDGTAVGCMGDAEGGAAIGIQLNDSARIIGCRARAYVVGAVAYGIKVNSSTASTVVGCEATSSGAAGSKDLYVAAGKSVTVYGLKYATSTVDGTLTYGQGDRASYSPEDYHCSDIEGTLTRHLPIATAEGAAVVSGADPFTPAFTTTPAWKGQHTFDAGLAMGDGQNIVAGTTTGTEVGTAANQKFGFYGATPVTQREKANYNNWAALSDVVNALVALGLFDQA